MRIRGILHALPLGARVKLGVIRLVAGHRPPPVIVGMYRPERFGRPFFIALDACVARAAHWSRGETELFATFVSHRSRCQFCVGAHDAVTTRHMPAETVAAALADPSTAPIEPRVRAALAFLEQLTLRPETLGPDDVARAVAAGVSQAALAEVAYIQACMAIINRMADTLDFDRPDASVHKRTARVLDRFGYKI